MRFGKHPPKLDYRTLRLADYLTDQIPLPPQSADVLPRVLAGLKADVPALFPLDGNDRIGDCTIAALAHAETVYAGMVGRHHVPSQNVVVKTYFHLTGGVDSGLACLDVLNYWRQHSVSSEKIAAFARIDPHNHIHVMQAIALFGGVYLGFQVQRGAIEAFDARQPWTPGPLTMDGHAAYATGYDPMGVTVLTWGSTQRGTWAWWDECVDECYAILPHEAGAAGFAPGLNLTQLKADLTAVAD
jgi:hypothetical protein